MEDELKEKMEKINKEFDDECMKILKDVIIGFMVVKYNRKDGSFFIGTEPLCTSWDGFGDNETVDIDDEIIGVIPAPQCSYKVLGLFPDNRYEFLGYEFRGAYSPDWRQILGKRIDQMKKRKEKEDRIRKGDTDVLFEE